MSPFPAVDVLFSGSMAPFPAFLFLFRGMEGVRSLGGRGTAARLERFPDIIPRNHVGLASTGALALRPIASTLGHSLGPAMTRRFGPPDRVIRQLGMLTKLFVRPDERCCPVQ